MTDLYVYYKVREEDAPALAPRVRAMQAGLAAALTGHGGALLQRRPETRDGLQTWMEVYPGVDAGFEAVLEQAVIDAGLPDAIQGPRRAEVFINLLTGT